MAIIVLDYCKDNVKNKIKSLVECDVCHKRSILRALESRLNSFLGARLQKFI